MTNGTGYCLSEEFIKAENRMGGYGGRRVRNGEVLVSGYKVTVMQGD